MIYLDENPESFGKRINLGIDIKNCPECGEDVIQDVPVRMKHGIGFITRRHGECKWESGTFRPLGDFKDVLNGIIELETGNET